MVTLRSVSLVFETILFGGGGGGVGGTSVRRGALIRGEYLIQSLHLKRGAYWIRGVNLSITLTNQCWKNAGRLEV